jgi:hypothetical protein
MTSLAPNLFDRRYQDFLEIGRARLPSLAPEWTDHNAHDPGIMLMELMAWVAEGQLYSLSRMRRDERAAYANLINVARHGTIGASGLIWPDRDDVHSPASTSNSSVVLGEDAEITPLAEDSRAFRPRFPILWTPGRTQRLEAIHSGGRRTDLTATNARGGTPFLPFGESAGRGDVLAMTFEARDLAGLFGAKRKDAQGALWAIGVQAAPPRGGAFASAVESAHCPSQLSATLFADGNEYDVPIKWDSTQGFLATGVLLLNLDRVTKLPQQCTVELRSRRGFPRPPRVLRIEPNVIPIVQGRKIFDESHDSSAAPDWEFSLQESGLQFAEDGESIELKVAETSELQTWEQCDRLSDCGPDARAYEFDYSSGRVSFGNGVNGRIPPSGARVLVTYTVSDGEAGRVARNQKWKAPKIPGIVGVNLDPIAGGAAAADWIEQRRDARRRIRESHVLVSSTDLPKAAMALPLLEVARAWTVVPGRQSPRTGVTTLIVLRCRAADGAQENTPESPRWLEAVRRELAPRMPLGSRLQVIAPPYASFWIEAVLVAERGRNSDAIAENVRMKLRERLSLVELPSSIPPREPGMPVSKRDIWTWVRGVDGVERIDQLRLRTPTEGNPDRIQPSRNGLPLWDEQRSMIKVERPEPGRPR